MNGMGKLSIALDDPEAQNLIFGLTHVALASSSVRPGPARLHAVVLRLAETTRLEQYGSWLSDDAANEPMTAEQVRLTIGGSLRRPRAVSRERNEAMKMAVAGHAQREPCSAHSPLMAGNSISLNTRSTMPSMISLLIASAGQRMLLFAGRRGGMTLCRT